MPSERELELLDGLVERVTFHNADSGYYVLRLKGVAPRAAAMVLSQ